MAGGRQGSFFNKLSSDRGQMAIKAVTSTFANSLAVGDITKGTVVEVAWVATSQTGSVTVRKRATGAIPLSVTIDTTAQYQWSIVGETLTVKLDATHPDVTFLFWVF